MSTRRTVTVPLSAGPYDVIVERGGYAGLGAAVRGVRTPRAAVLVTEETVGPLWGDAARASLEEAGFPCTVVVLPAGEPHKTVATWARCVDALLAAGVDRGTPVVALGGGVLGDVAGFAAASALRGLPLVQAPTTLLAMVDSSVGGKTGVNHPSGKNLVGAFHQPVLVYAALDALATLPPAERIAGLGEVVKAALIGDAALMDALERDASALRAGEPDVLAGVVARCVELKADVVARDVREGGWRAVLNAGHTVAHAYETACGFGALRHGEAVAIGLVAETSWAVRAGWCEDHDLPARLRSLLERLGLPTRPPRADQARLIGAMRLDKKARGDMLTVPVPVCTGQMRLIDVPVSELPALLPEIG